MQPVVVADLQRDTSESDPVVSLCGTVLSISMKFPLCSSTPTTAQMEKADTFDSRGKVPTLPMSGILCHSLTMRYDHYHHIDYIILHTLKTCFRKQFSF